MLHISKCVEKPKNFDSNFENVEFNYVGFVIFGKIFDRKLNIFDSFVYEPRFR